MSVFKAGAATVMVRIGDDCFPNAENAAKHDDVYVRAVIFGGEKLYGILEADMPSMFPSQIKFVKELFKTKAGVEEENSWVVVSHAFSGPHTWPLEAGEQKDTLRPKAIDEDPEMREKARKINEAYFTAYDEAISVAFASLTEARVGFGTGMCNLNVNRNVQSVDGWWEGVNHEGYVDHTLSVLRFDDVDGNPIAVLYGYSMKVDMMAGKFQELGGSRAVSGDIVGVASKYVEEEYGNGCTALFLCGATGDQACMLYSNFTELDKDGKVRNGSLGVEGGFKVMEACGRLLGNAILQVVRKTECTESNPEIKSGRCSYTVNCQKRDADMGRLKPAKEFHPIPNGTRELTIDAMIIGDIAMVGVLPELDGITVAEIRRNSPYRKTMVSCFVNGNSKSMPAKEYYSLINKAVQNSPFVEGSAEQTRDEAVSLLNRMMKS